ncbi:GntR family transcriptional regulator [Oscillatoria sp. CS-180]|uniref:GntR family transcriptional regulator n=1 Tax=Oscillatoria sp. CS-180 TaxID=3021720 RepID=UPI00232BCC37|nr:GntR family transcriptional regulator [Oscillatoria sp. CS-180]MDB9526419.1 GntR family transcriptional regulator [Oscillatoria sp. CS-180]
MTSLSKPIPRRESLHEQTYQALRTSILSGELLPGKRLVETYLAEQLQVSRTPIREALRQLQREGLVTDDASGGLRVISISIVDAVHLYDCRLALEESAVQAACLNATEPMLDVLQQSIIQAERAVQRQTSALNTFEMLNLDYQFHRKIAESTGNRWLTGLLDQVFDKMMLLRVHTTRHNPKVLEICNEHRDICKAIASRQPEIAMQAIRTHLDASKRRVIQAIETLHSTTK